MDYITEIGIGGLFALFLVREFLSYSKTQQGKKEKCEDDPRYRELEKKIERLYEMHRVYDQDGAPIWYRKRVTEERVDKIYHSLNNMRQALMAMHEAIKKIAEK